MKLSIIVSLFWWNYDQVKSRKKGQAVELIKLVSVGTYFRRFPKGQQASENARTLAQKYCMMLEPGYTLVEGFERRQRIKIAVLNESSECENKSCK